MTEKRIRTMGTETAAGAESRCVLGYRDATAPEPEGRNREELHFSQVSFHVCARYSALELNLRVEPCFLSTPGSPGMLLFFILYKNFFEQERA